MLCCFSWPVFFIMDHFSIKKVLFDNKIYILGHKYTDETQILHEIWKKNVFTYRKDFPPINSSQHLTSDAGWGCMLRAGQMMLAEALSRHFANHRHILDLSIDSFHTINTQSYQKTTISLPDCQTGDSLQWASPLQKKLSQAYESAKRTLIEYWYSSPQTMSETLNNSYYNYCKMDSFEAREDMFFKIFTHLSTIYSSTTADQTNIRLKLLEMFADDCNALFSIHNISTASTNKSGTAEQTNSPKSTGLSCEYSVPGKWFGPNSVSQAIKAIIQNEPELWLNFHVAMDNAIVLSVIRKYFETKSIGKNLSTPHDSVVESKISTDPVLSNNQSQLSEPLNISTPSQKSLILVIPLRLGLTNIIPAYFDALKAFFQIPQCLGILGGQPKHALWFFGYSDNDLIYFDPHIVQTAVPLSELKNLTNKLSKAQSFSYKDLDTEGMQKTLSILKSYHCIITHNEENHISETPSKNEKKSDDVLLNDYYNNKSTAEKISTKTKNENSKEFDIINGEFLGTMAFSQLDPSLCLAFYCKDLSDFNDLVDNIREKMLKPFTCPMFEVLEEPLMPFWEVDPQTMNDNMKSNLNPGNNPYESDHSSSGLSIGNTPDHNYLIGANVKAGDKSRTLSQCSSSTTKSKQNITSDVFEEFEVI